MTRKILMLYFPCAPAEYFDIMKTYVAHSYTEEEDKREEEEGERGGIL